MSSKTLVFAAALVGAVAAAGSVLAQPLNGGELFQQNCSACHQPMGQGIPGAFPALAGNVYVQSDPRNPAYTVTHGRGGMPNFSDDLSDAQIAAILSFVRSSWGNHAPPLDAAVVASVRSAASPPDPSAQVLGFH